MSWEVEGVLNHYIISHPDSRGASWRKHEFARLLKIITFYNNNSSERRRRHRVDIPTPLLFLGVPLSTFQLFWTEGVEAQGKERNTYNVTKKKFGLVSTTFRTQNT